MKYKYSLNNGYIKGTSLGWRLGDLTSYSGTNISSMKVTLNQQNEKLQEFFNRSDISKAVEENNWNHLFREWALLGAYTCDVLALFLIHQAGIDFLDNYDDEDAQKFIDTFKLNCEKVG